MPRSDLTNQNNMMGRASRSPYSVQSISHSKPRQESSGMSNKSAYMVLGVFVILGGLAVWLLHSNPPVRTGPVMVLQQSAAPDQSTIDNLTQSVLAIAGQVEKKPSFQPRGGASTPITTVG